MNFKPIFPLTPKIGKANISVANTNRVVTGVAGLTQVLAAGADGTRLDRAKIQATAATTAGVVRLWIYSGSGNADLYDEILVTAATPSTTVEAFNTVIDFNAEFLPAGYSLYASTHNGEAFNVIVFGGDF